MGIKDWLGIGSEIAKPIEAVGDLYTTDKARIEANTKLEDVLQKPVLAQIDLNKIFASSNNVFVSGWIPLLGWSCGFLLLAYYLPQIVIATWVWGHLCINSGIIKPFPMKPDDLMNLVYLLITSKIHSLIKK